MSKPNSHAEGALRFASDKRQLAGLLMLTGFCALIQPLFGAAAAIGANGMTPQKGVPLAALIGGLFVALTGVLSIFVGYMQVVHDWGHKQLTMVLLVWVQTAWIPYISNMTGVGKGISKMGFVPADYGPTIQDNQIIGAMGILGILAYGFGLVGSVAFLQFSLYAYQAGKPQDRNASYYKGRLSAYAFMLFVAGFSQTILGGHIISTFGNKLDKGPIQVAFYLINVPGLAVLVGTIQMVLGVWGVLRSFDFLINKDDPNDAVYQICLGIGWFIQLVCQVMVQASWLPGPAGAGIAPTVAAFSVGLSLMPAFLDYKMRTVPETITPEYYGLLDGGSEEGTLEDKEVAAQTYEYKERMMEGGISAEIVRHA